MTWIGLDLGGTKVYGVVVDRDRVTSEAKSKTGAGAEGVIAAIVEVVEALGTKGVVGIGLGCPGLVDAGAGTLRRASNLVGFDGAVPLAKMVSDATGGLPVTLENDVNAGVVAELRMGAAQGLSDVLGVWVGTGVGGGLVLDGRLRTGPHRVAGEIGHAVVRDGGRQCGCGGRGHLEAYAGRAGIERTARQAADAGRATVLLDLAAGGRMTSGVIARALDAGDALTMELLDEAVAALGAGLASATAILDVEAIVLGGGLADRLGGVFAGRVEQAWRERLFDSEPSVRLLTSTLGDRAGAIGAALVASGR